MDAPAPAQKTVKKEPHLKTPPSPPPIFFIPATAPETKTFYMIYRLCYCFRFYFFGIEMGQLVFKCIYFLQLEVQHFWS